MHSTAFDPSTLEYAYMMQYLLCHTQVYAVVCHAMNINKHVYIYLLAIHALCSWSYILAMYILLPHANTSSLQWYASTVSGSKNVYIVIHATDQSNFQTMINGALYVIDTLSHRDSTNVRFASHLDPLPQYGNGSLLPASNATRTQLKDFVIRSISFLRGQASILSSLIYSLPS